MFEFIKNIINALYDFIDELNGTKDPLDDSTDTLV